MVEWQSYEMKKQKETLAKKEAEDTGNKKDDAQAVLNNW
jgi:hypothetical protein